MVVASSTIVFWVEQHEKPFFCCWLAPLWTYGMTEGMTLKGILVVFLSERRNKNFMNISTKRRPISWVTFSFEGFPALPSFSSSISCFLFTEIPRNKYSIRELYKFHLFLSYLTFCFYSIVFSQAKWFKIIFAQFPSSNLSPGSEKCQNCSSRKFLNTKKCIFIILRVGRYNQDGKSNLL